MDSLINIGIIITYLMIGFASLFALGFAVKKIIQDQKNAKKTLYSIGGLVIVLIISYLIASDDVLSSYMKYGISESVSKQVGMGLITFYILAIAAIGSIIYSELSKISSK